MKSLSEEWALVYESNVEKMALTENKETDIEPKFILKHTHKDKKYSDGHIEMETEEAAGCYRHWKKYYRHKIKEKGIKPKILKEWLVVKAL